MKALLIVAGILLFIVCLLAVRIRLCLDFSGSLCVEFRILFLRFRLHPRRITPKRLIKKQKKAEKRARQQAKNAGTSPRTVPSKKQPKRKASPMAVFRLIVHILRSVYHKFPDCFHLYLKRCIIVIAGKDAAETAIRYGAARGALAWFCTLLDEVCTVKTTKHSVLSVDADFTGSETHVEISASLSTRVGLLLALLLRVFIAYLKRPRPKKNLPADTTTAAKKV